METTPKKLALMLRGVAFVGLVARLSLFAAGPVADANRAMTDDSSDYIDLARNLVTCGVFGKANERGRFLQVVETWREVSQKPGQRLACGLTAESFRAPGYPTFLAASSGGGSELRATLVAQSLLGGLSAILLGQVALALGLSATASLVVALLWAVHPALVLYDNLLLSESLFSTLGVAGLWAVTRRPSGNVTWLAGVAFGAASMVRPPIGLLYLPAAFAWGRSRGWPAGRLLAVIALGMLPPLLWVGRNVAVGEGMRISTSSEATLVFYTAPCVRSEAAGLDCERDWANQLATTDSRVRAALRPGDDPMGVARSQAVRDLMAMPGATARVHLRSLIKLAISHSLGAMSVVAGFNYQPSGLFSRFILGERSSSARRPSAELLLAQLLWTTFNGALLAAAVLGGISAMRARRWPLLGGALAIITMFSAIVGSLGQERFRLPMLIALFLLAGLAWDGARPRASCVTAGGESDEDRGPSTR